MVVCDWLSYFDLKQVKNDSPHSTILSGKGRAGSMRAYTCVIVTLSTGGNDLLVPPNLTLCWVLKTFQGSFSYSAQLFMASSDSEKIGAYGNLPYQASWL